jgi:hypothetical protein
MDIAGTMRLDVASTFAHDPRAFLPDPFRPLGHICLEKAIIYNFRIAEKQENKNATP